MDKYVNTDIGIYHIKSVCNTRSAYGHKLYHVKCLYCDFESDMRMVDIKFPKICRHKSITGRIIDFKFLWENRRLENIYKQMISRCHNPNDKSYKWYGQKGISVCDEWLQSPKTFEDWAFNNGYSDDLTIDRIKSNENYAPNNCRWISMEENSRRAGNVNWITVNDITLTGRQWAEKLNVGTNTINKAIRECGIDKTRELIVAMMEEPPSTKNRKPQQSWFSVYGVLV